MIFGCGFVILVKLKQNMEIKYLGHSSFLIKSKESRLVTDPYDSFIGIKFPKIEADVVTVSHAHKDHNRPDLVLGDPLVINLPGEFERHGIRIFGYQSFHDKKGGAERGPNILYKIEVEGLTILHCGDLGLVPDEKFLDNIGDIDILMLPVGGVYAIDADEAVELIKKIEPSVVIPMHYLASYLDQKRFSQLAPVSEFLKKIGREDTAAVSKLVVKKEELGEEMKVVVMEIL